MSVNYIVNSNVNPTKSYSFKATFKNWVNAPETDIFYPVNSEGKTDERIKIGINSDIHSEEINIEDGFYNEIFNSVAAYLMISFVYNDKNYTMKFHKEHAQIRHNNEHYIDFTPPLSIGVVNNNTSHFSLYMLNEKYGLIFHTCYKGLNAIDNVIEGSTFDITIKYI